jgi:hypothetical protein
VNKIDSRFQGSSDLFTQSCEVSGENRWGKLKVSHFGYQISDFGCGMLNPKSKIRNSLCPAAAAYIGGALCAAAGAGNRIEPLPRRTAAKLQGAKGSIVK